jgi:hypothetical protein
MTQKSTGQNLCDEVLVAFSDENKAASFERYLRPGSGHAFAGKRLW